MRESMNHPSELRYLIAGQGRPDHRAQNCLVLDCMVRIEILNMKVLMARGIITIQKSDARRSMRFIPARR